MSADHTPGAREDDDGPDFATWLLRQVENDEQCAKAAGHGFGHLPVGTDLNGTWTRLELTENVRPTYDQRFAREHNPDRVVAECEVKRELIDLHANRAGSCACCGGYWPCLTLRRIASVYAPHSDFREEWAA